MITNHRRWRMRIIVAGWAALAVCSLCQGAVSTDVLDGLDDAHIGRYSSEGPGPDYLTTTESGKALKVTDGSAAAENPDVAEKIYFDAKETNGATACFSGRTPAEQEANAAMKPGRSAHWGCMYTVNGEYTGSGGAVPSPDTWTNKFKDKPRIVLEINDDGDADNIVPSGGSGTLTVTLKGGSAGLQYTVSLSSSPNNIVEIVTTSFSLAGEGGTRVINLNGLSAGVVTITASCNEAAPDTAQVSLKVVSAEIISVGFTSDHSLLKKNPTSGSIWGNSSTAMEKPEWIAGGRNNPISHTKDTKISVTVTVKVEPSDVAFDLTGSGSGYMTFPTTSRNSTGANQGIDVTATDNLPNRVCFRQQSCNWTIKVGTLQCCQRTSGPHKMYVTWGTPSGIATQKRMEWSCNGQDLTTENKVAVHVRDKAHAGTWFMNGKQPPSPIWNALLNNEDNAVDCIAAASLAATSLTLLGVPDASIDYAHPTGANPAGNKDASDREQDFCPIHGVLYLRYAQGVPARSETDPTGAYLNNFEGCFKVKIADVWNYYTVWDPSGPFADPNGLLRVLNNVQNLDQWWSYTLPYDIRYRDLDSLPNKVTLPTP